MSVACFIVYFSAVSLMHKGVTKVDFATFRLLFARISTASSLSAALPPA